MGWDVMNRRNEFTKPRDKYKMLEAYGPNVTTAEGKVYNFHVRITAPPFSDQNGANDLVWKETMFQTRLLMESWSKETSRELQLDVNALTLAVISLTGFGRRVDWTSKSKDESKPPSGYRISFLKAIHDTTGYITAILLFPRWFLSLTPWREAAVAHQQLEKYMRELIRSEKAQISQNKDHQSSTAHGNLLKSLLKASAAEGAANSNPNTKKQGFTEDEVLGNLFLYLLAGYETTANAILYGLIVLALRPDLQANVALEIDRIHAEATSEGRTELTYMQDFEKLEYTYGFMYETFRLYPGVIIVTKMVNEATSILVSPTEGPDSPPRTHILPRECRVYLNAPAVHYTERYWPDCTVLDPSRWAKAVTAPNRDETDLPTADKKVVAADKTRQVRGSLLTFSGGARACLGRKFAQSEFISFLVTLLKDHEVVLGPGMDPVTVKRDIDLRAAGKLTLSPVDNIKLGLKKRVK
ncbi:MAG: Cytochrome P450 monooxygenase prx9 [Claussenomyces sp. TS43310]|nr:MAG: Cytochrome P450 monooxygenase prx9 [Claussenomyces sp. TS43310]